MSPPLKRVYSSTEPNLPGYEVVGVSQQLRDAQQLCDDDQPSDVAVEDMPLWHLAPVKEPRRRPHEKRRHDGRLRKRQRKLPE